VLFFTVGIVVFEILLRFFGESLLGF